MYPLQYFSLRSFLDKHLLDENARWFLELEETPELNPVRDYTVVIEKRYEHSVSLDLDTRVHALCEMFGNKKCNKRYLTSMLWGLRKKCVQAGREDLVGIIDAEAITREL